MVLVVWAAVLKAKKQRSPIIQKNRREIAGNESRENLIFRFAPVWSDALNILILIFVTISFNQLTDKALLVAGKDTLLLSQTLFTSIRLFAVGTALVAELPSRIMDFRAETLNSVSVNSLECGGLTPLWPSLLWVFENVAFLARRTKAAPSRRTPKS